MSGSDPPDDSEFPFGDMSQLFGGLSGAGGDPWATAKQIAVTVASEGGAEPNLDPLVRMAVEDLARVADLHVRQVPGLRLAADTTINPVSRTGWANESFEAYRPFFERFGEAIGQADSMLPEESAGDPLSAMLGQMFKALGPMMVAASAGSMIGHLAQRALGQYDLPIPRTGNAVLVIPEAIDRAAVEWGIEVDELRLWTMVHELVAHGVLSTPHVRSRVESLVVDFAAGFNPSADAIGELFGDINDLTQIQSVAESLNDPETVLALMRSPAQDLLIPQLDALVAAILGYVDHTVATVCRTLIPGHEGIAAHLRGRALDAAPADRFMEQLLGIEITERTIDRGAAFIAGIVERAGDEGLARLWADELDLPTAAEVDAPGLWLARIGLDPDLPAGSTMEIPDDLSGLDDL